MPRPRDKKKRHLPSIGPMRGEWVYGHALNGTRFKERPSAASCPKKRKPRKKP